MGSKVWHMFLLFALAMVAECTKFDEVNSGIHHRDNNSRDSCIGEPCNIKDEIFMDSETNIRLLAARRYISYEALKRNNVPCSQQGRSYYECSTGKPVNPYSRGCTYATRCRRYTA
ncbi:hypothetical protein Golax_003898 [Gossypium laxum]|uniref:Uncharacterized protein n=1 Tax=Gossypium laxum TaxID=34288 RepID=A0A7J9AH43_9ROSI|nr:hypothetical protein [Gossypium laxum]